MVMTAADDSTAAPKRSPSMPSNAVEVDHLSHVYGDRTAVDDVSISVGAGEIFGLLGPNGGGKTTLFRILATLLTPTRGSARVIGSDVVSGRAVVRRSLGIIFQYPSLDGKLTVRENMIHQGQIYGLSGATLAKRSDELLDFFELSDRRDDRAEKLSGGLQRRVEIAKSLLHRPRCLLLDEPSTGLDPAARISLMSLLHDLRERDGVTCLLTTHLMDEADRCDRIAFLDLGRLAACDSPAALKSQVGGDLVSIAAKETEPLARRISQQFGVEAQARDGAVRIELRNGHEFVPKVMASFANEVESVTVSKPTLEDVFLHVTGHGFSETAADGKEK
ncbi:MAG: ABC transporter ATP-binding protein [Planctomycetes bacterium]|nr:ABC transporter ATP-binding protein [Planctomycetota bacterium]MBI3833315.1 ABC transporter ATP-binding protein [Planctomycetota bacterium]